MKRLFAVLLSALCGVGASPAASWAADVSIGSPVIFVDGLGAPASITCYFSNVGDRKVRIFNREIFRRGGDAAAITSNTCGDASGFNLGPGKVCFVVTIFTQTGGYGCKARVEGRDAKMVRGAVELRDASPVVLNSEPLSAAATGAAEDKFRTIASPPTFGSPTQRYASCLLTNLGSKTARLKNYELRTSNDEVIPTRVSFCEGSGEIKIGPGQTCAIASAGVVPVGDLRCRASVTRAADIRGSLLIIGDGDVILNSRPVR